MTILVRILVLFSLSFSSFAQDFEKRMEGSFSLNNSDISPPTVNFSISWNEANGEIQGIYSDNYFVSSAEVSGSSLLQGKSFLVDFPIVTNGVRSIAIMAIGAGPGSVPLTLTLRDTFGNASSIHNVTAVMIGGEATSENVSCSVGFGALTGYCGLYAGNINEISDTGSLCYRVASSATRLELAPTMDMRMYLGYRDTIVGLPSHPLGSLPISPVSGEVSLTGRNCGELSGTRFPPGSCQTMTLSGSFTELVGVKRFNGTYVITDDETEETCTYSLTLDREVGY
jgi:hypothetical protein